MFKITWSCGISKVRFERVGDRSFLRLRVTEEGRLKDITYQIGPHSTYSLMRFLLDKQLSINAHQGNS